MEPAERVQKNSSAIITHPGYILHILQQVLDRRLILTVTSPVRADKYSSTILKIAPQRGLLYLDELHPRRGHEIFLKEGKVNAHTVLDGVQVIFETVLEQASIHRGIAYYRTYLPTSVYYPERRSYRRFRSVSPFPLFSGSLESNGISIQGRIADLCMHGFSFEIENTCTPTVGENLQVAIVEIPKFGITVTSSRVCHVTVYAPGKARIGIEIQQLDRESRQQYVQYLRYLEREHLKKRHARLTGWSKT